MSHSLNFFRWHNLKRRIWFPVACYGVLGVAAALFALTGKYWIPDYAFIEVGSRSVGNILQILATSMLAVSTFSLTTMVTAYANAASNATPRASRLLVEDETAQRAIGTFIGSFVYGIVGVIALATNFYEAKGRFLLFIITIVVIFMIVTTLVRWINRLSNIGQLNEVIKIVESAARKSIVERARYPYMRANPGPRKFDHGLSVPGVGYFNFIDLNRLQELAEKNDFEVSLNVSPGSYNYPGSNVAQTSKVLDKDCLESVRKCFVIGEFRTFDQDPRHGLIVLSQIGMRALSPAINDPGTAIDVMGTLLRLLDEYLTVNPESIVTLNRIYVLSIDPEDILDDCFTGMARHSVEYVEVQIRLQKVLTNIARHPSFRLAASEFAKKSLERSFAALGSCSEYERIEKVARRQII